MIRPDPNGSLFCISLRLSWFRQTLSCVEKGSARVTHRNFEAMILFQEAVRKDLLDPPKIHGKSGLLSAESNPPKDFIIGRNVRFGPSDNLTERRSYDRIKNNNTRPASQRCAPGGFFILRAGQ